MASTPTYILTVSCPDRIGIVADVAAFLVANDCNIVESGQFNDQENGRFFLRTAFQPRSGISLDALRKGFAAVAERFGYEVRDWIYVRKDGSRLSVSLAVTAVRASLARAGAGEVVFAADSGVVPPGNESLGFLFVGTDQSERVRSYEGPPLVVLVVGGRSNHSTTAVSITWIARRRRAAWNARHALPILPAAWCRRRSWTMATAMTVAAPPILHALVALVGHEAHASW